MQKEWILENYKEGTVTLDAEKFVEDYETREETRTPGVSFKHTVKIFDCQKTTFIINGKCKNIFLDNCKNCQIVVNSVVTGVEMSKCNTCKVQGIENMPFVNIEQSIETKIFLTHATKKCRIQAMCARSINVRFPREGADDQSQEDKDWVTEVIPEVFEVSIDPEKEKCIISPV